jgi:hypothetical protein
MDLECCEPSGRWNASAGWLRGLDDSCRGAQDERGSGELAKFPILIRGRDCADQALEAAPQHSVRDAEFPKKLLETRQVCPRGPGPESVREDHNRVLRGWHHRATTGPLRLQGIDGLSHELTAVRDFRRQRDRLRSHLIPLRIDSPELGSPAASRPSEPTRGDLSRECSGRVLLECRDRPAPGRLSPRKKDDKKLLEPALECVSTPRTLAEPEHENPDPDEDRPGQRGALQNE